VSKVICSFKCSENF